MNEEILYHYMKHQSTARERAAIADWLEADASNRELLDRMSLEMETLALIAPELDDMHERSVRRTTLRGRLVRWSAAAAAAVVLCVGSWYAADHNAREEFGGRVLSFQTSNAPVRYTLSDGTEVWLNAGTRLEYPAAFTGRERRVRVSGEALFDVKHDAGHPFIVETYACDVDVLGTRFDVAADAEAGTFSTALLEGRVELRSKLTGERLTLKPEDCVNLIDGRLCLTSIRSHDDYLWPEGILSISGCTFEEVMAKLEKIYGVQIRIERTPAPELRVARGKLWTSMGLDTVLRTLQDVTMFRYVHDEQTNAIYIR